MTQPTAADTVNGINASLTKAFVEREDAQTKVDEANKTITALRNVLAGVQVGQKLQTEVLAEQAAKETPAQ